MTSTLPAPTPTSSAWHTLLELGAHKDSPLHARLAQALREAIRSRRLPEGSALPPSRTLAEDLGCSRWVVTEAFGQLVAEGYLEARVGSATRVRHFAHAETERAADPLQDHTPALRIDLRPGLPDLAAFPLRAWMAALRSAASRLSDDDLAYPERSGHRRLREVLAAYLARVRGTAGGATDLTICTGITDGIGRACQALQHAGFRAIAVEDPAWLRLRRAAAAAGLEIVPIPVDEHGLCVEQLDARTPVRAVVVSPAHQFPTGVVLSSERRAALVRWARRVDGLILEDDYDAEFRYDRRAIGAMQGTDPDRVMLLGSVSKTLSPALRLGWMLTPPAWTEAIRTGESSLMGPPVLDQLAFAALLQNGAYDRHVRRSRRRYRLRRDRLTSALTRFMPDARLSGIAAGMHIVVRLQRAIDYPAVVTLAAARGIGVVSMDWCSQRDPATANGLVLGYGNLADSAVDEGVAMLAAVIDQTEARRDDSLAGRARAR